MDDLPARIDHTVLGPTTTPADADRVADEAAEYGTNVCVPPCYVARVSNRAPETTVATVVGFPHGNNVPETKVEEGVRAVDDGADELDVVLNVGRLLAGEADAVRSELAELTAAVSVPVKAIVEAPLLDEDDLRRACDLAAEADCEFVKTATGFSEGGATVDDVEVMAEYLPVKASGGIGSWERARAMFEAGAERIGASSGVTIVEEWRAAGSP